MGGIAVPSLAVTKKNNSLHGFGDVTLIGSKAMADPKGYAKTKVFGADIYSPRYPDVILMYTSKAKDALEKRLLPWLEATGDRLDFDEMGRQRRAFDYLKGNRAVLAEFLDSKGIKPEIIKSGENSETEQKLKESGYGQWLGTKDWQKLVRDPEFQQKAVDDYINKLKAAGLDERALKAEEKGVDDEFRYNMAKEPAQKISRLAYEGTDEKPDKHETQKALEAQVKDNDLVEERDSYVKQLIEKMNPEEKIFQGFSNSGNRRYKAHTLETVVSILKKELRGGESFNYGIGSLRAKFTPEFKTIEQIRKNKDRLMTKDDFEKVKNEIDDDFNKIADDLRAFSTRGKEFGFSDTVISIMEDSATMGINRALKEYRFDDVSQETKQEMAEFLEKLRHLPTEYFEAKILRDVNLAEFSGAVIPDNASPKVRAELATRGIDAREYKHGNEEDRKRVVDEFSTELDQKKGDILFQENNDKQGFFRFSASSPEREIGILEKADLSTFLHETGHSWLEELKDDALRPDAPEQLKQDWETIKKELGVEGDTLSREQHEQWARSTEAYLMEGKAPSAELAGIFSRFKLWLAQIYKTMSGLNVKMTDEVRGVMDRLLASDEEIKRAQDDMGQKPLFVTPEEAGMTAREFEAYRKDAEAGSQKARDVLSVQLMKELKREQEAWWKTEKDKVRTEVMDEAKQNPVYVALQEILKGKDFEGNDSPGLKMNRDELVKRYGEDFVKKLPKGSATEFLYAKEGGIDPDLLAEKYGFSSGDEMIRKMMETPSLKRFVSAEADLRMKERNGDMRLDGSIADEAMNAIHNDHWAEVLRAEIKALKRKANDVKPYVDAATKDATEQAKKDAEATARWTDAERKQKEDQDRAKRNAAADRIPPVSTFREAARQQIGAKIVKELAPHLYLNAERKAAREAFEANGKGDYEKAADARIKQMLNHFLYAESVKAKEVVDTIQKYAVKMGSAKELGKMGKAGQDFLDQIQGILNRYSFDKISNKEADIRQEHRESLDTFLTRLADPEKGQGIDLPIPDAIRMEIQQENYRNMPVDDLKAVYDSMRMIEHVAKRINSVNAEGKRVEIVNAAMSLANRLFRSIKGKPDMERKSDKAETLMDKVKDVNADISVMLPEFMFNRFDGNKKTGEWHEYIWDRYNDAADHQIRLRESIFPKIMEFAHGDKIDRSKGKIYIEGIKASLVKDDIIAIALNCGNESNMDKLMRGGLRFKGDEMSQPLDHDQLNEILSHLTKDEIDVVNGIWKTIESLKPEAAALARKRTGIEPKWIEAQPMEIKNGTLEGGYYPVKYDSRYSAAGEKQSDSSTLDQMFNKYASTSTRQGYMKERTNAAYPMSLDWQSTVSRHLDEVITDISHWEFASDTQRLLKRAEVKDAILDRLGNSYYKNLLDWVKYTVNQDNVSPEASDSIEQFRRKIRSNMSTFVLGFKVTNAMAEMAIGIPLMTQHVKFESAFKGVMQYMRNPKEATAFAVEASDYMKNLDKEFDRNVTEALQDLAGKHTVIDDIRSWSIASRVFFWKIGATMAWHAGYQDAMSQGLQGKAAVRIADSIYRMTQESGRAGDLSAVQRNPYMKEMTMFIGPTLIQYNNIARSARAFKDQGLNKDTAKLGLTTLMCGIVANQILFEVLRGKTPDEKDKIPAWMMARLTLGLVDGFPILRDVAGYAEGKILGEHGKDMKLAPVFQFGKDVVDGASKTIKAASGEGDWQKAIVQDAKVIGGATGLPTLQGSITGQYLYDVLSGNYTPEHPWSPATDIFYARKKH